jgi:Chaperone of endosialidase
VTIDTTTGQLGIPLSSARYKQDIAPMGSEGVLNLRPVTFAYREDAQHVKHYGLIAEEVAAVYPELVTHTTTGEVQTVKYQELIPMLVNELQRQRSEFQQALKSQQQELAELRALVEQAPGSVECGTRTLIGCLVARGLGTFRAPGGLGWPVMLLGPL